ncbi:MULTISPECIES: GNAT family N-acetyltransferase [unclassified Haematospirillum]|uniref:GNAT family N-acetyltransferase n=1 Tax=unclassified Haematospirillum TaxID=2622088 RepID=UPI0014389CE5|nr:MULTISPECIES: GNAT family N-acetyltransferase [unclassified Haematospirillum]NKD55742.1 GNAT family N-acetyltransferase [Haematospirillum sp. H4890]NKD75823.1 GNAT family N-acetyltransferase [Haematospirillum sp. H4485]
MKNEMDIMIRRVLPEDSEDIWKWRNDPLTRKMSTFNGEINRESHQKWFTDSVSDINIIILIGVNIDNSKKIGLCRFNIRENEKIADVSINLNPEFRGIGLSSLLLMKSLRIFLSIHEYDVLSQIRKVNLPSIRCFRKCGFSLYDCDADYDYYALYANKDGNSP